MIEKQNDQQQGGEGRYIRRASVSKLIRPLILWGERKSPCHTRPRPLDCENLAGLLGFLTNASIFDSMALEGGDIDGGWILCRGMLDGCRWAAEWTSAWGAKCETVVF